MEETLTEMLGELQDMRREINLIHNNTLRSKCHTPVSYTHLDVYKRQLRDNSFVNAVVCRLMIPRSVKNRMVLSMKNTVNGVIPVSYTHLNKYKWKNSSVSASCSRTS